MTIIMTRHASDGFKWHCSPQDMYYKLSELWSFSHGYSLAFGWVMTEIFGLRPSFLSRTQAGYSVNNTRLDL